jgi:hypothetical protein
VRTDQYDRLKTLSEQLIDVVLIEGDAIKLIEPKVKPAKGSRGAHYHNAERRLHWRKKNTMATLGILMRIHSLVSIVERKSIGEPPAPDEQPDRDVEALIESSEKEVEGILAGLRRRRDE